MNTPDSTTTRRYDGELQMFCDEARQPELDKLQFLRWLAEQGRLEHAIAGPSTGEYVEAAQAS